MWNQIADQEGYLMIKRKAENHRDPLRPLIKIEGAIDSHHRDNEQGVRQWSANDEDEKFESIQAELERDDARQSPKRPCSKTHLHISHAPERFLGPGPNNEGEKFPSESRGGDQVPKFMDEDSDIRKDPE
jgi:hypothetical protein